jgi:proteic killer suppression protein
VQISFGSSKIAKLCNEEQLAIRKLGPVGGMRLMQRIDDIASAPNLEVLKLLPGRAHPMTAGARANEEQWTVDLEHPQRLVFIPDHDPIPLRDDGGLDLKQVTAVCIIEVADTHE